MRRRQFIKAIAAIAAVIIAPIKAQETTHSIWIKSPDAKALRSAYKNEMFAQMYGRGRRSGMTFQGTQTGRFSGAHINFTEIEKRVAAHMQSDGKWHQYAQNSHGQMFFDGRQV